MVDAMDRPEQRPEDEGTQSADGTTDQPMGGDDAFGSDELDGDDDELEGLTVVEEDEELDDD